MKPPCVEPGKPLNWCARALHEREIEGRLELPPEWWKGWRVCKDRLIGPGGMTFRPNLLVALYRLERLRNREKRRVERNRCGSRWHGARSSPST